MVDGVTHRVLLYGVTAVPLNVRPSSDGSVVIPDLVDNRRCIICLLLKALNVFLFGRTVLLLCYSLTLTRSPTMAMSNIPRILARAPFAHTSKRHIISKAMQANLGPKPSKPAPFPYKEKEYTLFRSMIDKTTHRFDENTKLIVLEGSVGVGKTAVGKHLAELLGMHFMPDITMDTYYINDYGYDLRKLDPQLPINCRSFDENNFLENPEHFNAASFQIIKFKLRYAYFIDAIAHMLNTGEGVIVERSPYSDFAFIEAMYKCKYVSKKAREVYYTLHKHCMPDLLHPNVVIYLDAPVPKVLDFVKERNLSHEINSKAMNTEYLETLENNLKYKFLRDASNYAEVLVYDWSEGGDAEVIVEDLERLDLENYDEHDPKIKDWSYSREQYWADVRMLYTNDKASLMSNFNVPVADVPELNIPGEEVEILTHAYFYADGNTHETGYDPKYHSFSEILFKTKTKKESWDPWS